MVVFAIETVTRRGSMALVDDAEAASWTGPDGRTHGERLPREATDWLAARGRSLRAIDLFAVITGPGSFTGLRVGLATVQGWAEAGQRRVVGVSTFEALVHGWIAGGTPSAGVVAACVDGQRGEVFVSIASVPAARGTGEALPLTVPFTAAPADAAAHAIERAGGRPVAFIGDGAARYRDVIARLAPAAHVETVEMSLAESAARLAHAAPARAVAPHALQPVYVRRPDAEITRARQQRARDAAATPVVHTAPAGAAGGLVVRRAGGAGDLAAVGALQRQTFTNPWGAEAIQWELEHTDVARLYVINAPDGTLVGYCACWIVFDELHINSLAVDEAWRRRGAARRLLDEIFADVTASGARSATLEVRASNVAALRLYEGLGFTVEGTRRDYYQSPREDALILWRRQLNPVRRGRL